MRFRITLVTVLLATFFVNAQQKKWTLKECVEYALEHNITIKQSELDLENIDIDRLDAIGNFIPSLNGNSTLSSSTGLSTNPTTGILENTVQTTISAGISSGVTLFDGLRNLKQLTRAKLNKVASQYRLDDIKDDISLAVANGYLQILFNRENLVVAQAQYAVTEQDLNRTKELVSSGVVPKGDLLEIEATAATQEQQIINSENALRLSKIALAQLLLIQDYENFDIANENFLVPTSTILNNTPRTIFDKAVTFRNDIKFSETNVELAKKDLEISKGASYPTLNGFFNYNTRYTDQIPADLIQQFYTFDGISYGVQLNVPIFNGFNTSNRIKRSKIALDKAQLQLEQDKLDLENTVNQAWNDTQAALKAYEAAQKTLIARTEAYNYAKERFNVGLMNSFDFSQAQSRLENAQAEEIRTKFDYIFKLKVLEFYFGIPIDDLN
ncbi:TolC family protein [Leptobacterium flavescens]|uniref:TolC family protein n=1 Tax=Leptobacterium flavescens TaxID=472055 RepID=A0A6P0UQH3_9FLAO|nr:TolC family protein [Leptobacterium flavescens]NER12646.1 TolC family protein [Leptobacterium flavescens]